jgi:hypothetical protein
MRSVMIVASILGACSASTAVNAQTSDADFARAKEKLKAALKDQIVPTKSDAANNFSIADYFYCVTNFCAAPVLRSGRHSMGIAVRC